MTRTPSTALPRGGVKRPATGFLPGSVGYRDEQSDASGGLDESAPANKTKNKKSKKKDKEKGRRKGLATSASGVSSVDGDEAAKRAKGKEEMPACGAASGTQAKARNGKDVANIGSGPRRSERVGKAATSSQCGAGSLCKATAQNMGQFCFGKTCDSCSVSLHDACGLYTDDNNVPFRSCGGPKGCNMVHVSPDGTGGDPLSPSGDDSYSFWCFGLGCAKPSTDLTNEGSGRYTCDSCKQNLHADCGNYVDNDGASFRWCGRATHCQAARTPAVHREKSTPGGDPSAGALVSGQDHTSLPGVGAVKSTVLRFYLGGTKFANRIPHKTVEGRNSPVDNAENDFWRHCTRRDTFVERGDTSLDPVLIQTATIQELKDGEKSADGPVFDHVQAACRAFADWPSRKSKNTRWNMFVEFHVRYKDPEVGGEPKLQPRKPAL